MTHIEIVNLEERARTAISLGESHFREFKSALEGAPGAKTPRDVRLIARDIGEALVAFANADGGELLVGVEDDGQVSGIELLPLKDVRILESAPQTHVHKKTPLPAPRVAILEIGSSRVIYYSVQKSSSHVHLTSDGRCVQRRDLETVPIPPEEILLDRKERESREYDRKFVDGATAADLNYSLVKVVADQLSPGMSVEKCLQYLDLAEYIGPGLRLRRAALLLFAKEPARWHPRMQVRILTVSGNELKSGGQYNVKSDQTIAGNVVELIERAWEGLRPRLVQTRLGQAGRFELTVMYPELACREALVNAIAHRDYSEEGRGIEIYVFDDRMEVRNPGSLLSVISLNDLLRLEGVHQSRNAMVCRVLRELGYMRELGEGLRRMFELMRTSELSPPELSSDANSFRVVLHHSTIYNQPQQLWLSQFDSYALTREQKAVIVLGIGGKLVAPQDIWDNLGLVDTEYYRQLVASLQDLGILTSDISKAQAQRKARRERKGVRQIPRFRIESPRKGTSLGHSSVQAAKAIADTAKATPGRTDAPNEEARLFIGNLPRTVDQKQLLDFLSAFGSVQDLHVPSLRGQSKGYAFVEYESRGAAAAAMTGLHEAEFGGRRLRVSAAHPRVPITKRSIGADSEAPQDDR